MSVESQKVEVKMLFLPEDVKNGLVDNMARAFAKHAPRGRNMLAGSAIGGTVDIALRLLMGDLSKPDAMWGVLNTALISGIVAGAAGKINWNQASDLAIETLRSSLGLPDPEESDIEEE